MLSIDPEIRRAIDHFATKLSLTRSGFIESLIRKSFPNLVQSFSAGCLEETERGPHPSEL